MDIKKPNGLQPSRHVETDSTEKRVNNIKQKSTVAITALVVSLVALVAVGVLAFGKLNPVSADMSGEVMNDRFQAVFLTNGQVYFGKLSNPEGNYVKLENIYYLQVQQSVQPSTANPEEQSASDSQVSLTKLGKELHGPTDQMYISRSEVLFWENLEKDSTVVKAIADYEDEE